MLIHTLAFVLAAVPTHSPVASSCSSRSPDSAATTSAPRPTVQGRALDDPTIVAIFDAANTADIETGKLAAERGSTSEVRAFGTMLVNDHTGVRQMGRDLARKLGVTPTPPADDAGKRDHAAAMAKLRALSGPEFDRAFLAHEESFHASVITAVNSTLLPAIQNTELKALVTKVAPAFEGHRRAAADLGRRLASK